MCENIKAGLFKSDQKARKHTLCHRPCKEGIASRFKGNIDIIDRIDNWQGTGKIFEYYSKESRLRMLKVLNARFSNSFHQKIDLDPLFLVGE